MTFFYIGQKEINFYIFQSKIYWRITKEIDYFFIWSSTLEVQEHYSLTIEDISPFCFCTLFLFGQSTMRREKELFQVTFWTYIYTLALFCSLFFLPSSSSSSSFILSTCRDDSTKKRKVREIAYIVKQIFFVFFFSSFFSHSLCLNDIRSNTLNTYIFRSLSRWPQNKNTNTIYMCNFHNIKFMNTNNRRKRKKGFVSSSFVLLSGFINGTIVMSHDTIQLFFSRQTQLEDEHICVYNP
jgi:hypothetical protein